MYMRCHASKNGIDLNAKKTLFYAICSLYVLSVAAFGLHIAEYVVTQVGKIWFITNITFFNLAVMQILKRRLDVYIFLVTISGFCDFTTQSILVRTLNLQLACLSMLSLWFNWFIQIFEDLPLLDCVGSKYPCRDHSLSSSIHILRSVNLTLFTGFKSNLPVLCLAIWIAGVSSTYISSNKLLVAPQWANTANRILPAIPLIVNGVVTGLIVFKIFKVFQGIEMISNEQHLSAAGGRKLWSVIFALVESGLAFFSFQLAQLVLGILPGNIAFRVNYITSSITQMINVIICC